jgi:hypothetical protein
MIVASLDGNAVEYATRAWLTHHGFHTVVPHDELPYDIGIDMRDGRIIYIQCKLPGRNASGKWGISLKNHKRIGQDLRVNLKYQDGAVDFFIMWIPGTWIFYVIPACYNGCGITFPVYDTEGEAFDKYKQFENNIDLIRNYDRKTLPVPIPTLTAREQARLQGAKITKTAAGRAKELQRKQRQEEKARKKKMKLEAGMSPVERTMSLAIDSCRMVL